jgi:uncharacterized membrane protein/sporulation protein YlmC with PRC-barrel domain
MIKFPLNTNAKAQLLDRKVAEVYSVVIDPARQVVVYFIAQDANQQRWLVPLKDVIDADDELVRLRLTEEEFNQLESFNESKFRREIDADDDFFKASDPGTHPIFYVPDLGPEMTIAPDKDLALIRGALVEASDGFVGTVEEIAIDPNTGAATEIIIHTEGRGKVEYTLPVSMIDRAQIDTVYLKLTREEVLSLPAIPVEYSKTGKIRYHMVAILFETVDGAKEGYKQWKEVWAKQSTRFIHSAAFIECDQEGEVKFSETADLDKRHGRLFGAVTGGLVGLVGGPVGVVVGVLAGAGVGGFTADKIDRGMSDKFLEHFSQHLKPGTSALVVMMDSEGVPALTSSVGQLGGLLVQEEITEEFLKEYLEEETGYE